MKILTVDIGTGTQDIYLYNSNQDMENNIKMVVPSPTMMVRRWIKKATGEGTPILLIGVMMGGGPSAWAVEDHLRKGLSVYATPEAARTLDDDLENVKKIGVRLVGEDEAARLPGDVRRITMRDFDFPAIASAFRTFGIALDDLSAVAVAVFDHGNAPPGTSDRQFRFDYLDERIRSLNRLSAFAYRAQDVPRIMTRLGAVVESAQGMDYPLVVMDTAPAAVLGATLDPQVSGRRSALIANVGNFHTLAFRLGEGGIEGLFEHHTGLVDIGKLEHLLHALADGSLRHAEVFGDHGHGALVYNPTALCLDEGSYDVVVTGPRRSMFLDGSADGRKEHLRPYYPAPFGDMMITGCFGLLAATANVMPELAEPIRASLHGSAGRGIAPWDTD
ncbi:MAG: hypothetical protein A2136_10445 [Chloroflexi bacterium RBG_16_54_11]|nr:MAG: hypothetical protein A2136_10445 [Chloroflexi bacterium RBG_16_54_11]